MKKFSRLGKCYNIAAGNTLLAGYSVLMKARFFALKLVSIVGLWLIYSDFAGAQPPRTLDSLLLALSISEPDTARADLLYKLAGLYYYGGKRDSCKWYNQEGLNLSRKLDYEKGILNGQLNLSVLASADMELDVSNNYIQATLVIHERNQDTVGLVACYHFLGNNLSTTFHATL